MFVVGDPRQSIYRFRRADIGVYTRVREMIEGSAEAAPQFTRGYGLAFGHSERKAMAMALVDRALRAGEFGEDTDLPANNEEFVLAHSDRNNFV